MKPTDDLQSWAAAYRSDGLPSEALRARILAAVDEAETVRPIRLVRRPWRDGVVHACVGALAAIAALMVLGWITRWMSGEVEQREDPSTAPYHQSPRDDARPTAAPVESRVEPAELAVTPPVAPDPPGVASPMHATAPGDTSRRPTEATSPAPADTGGDLESLRLLRSAKQLLPTDPARARAILEAHARSYPNSALALEREALWIRAACRAGGEPPLEARRAAFARRPGIAAYLVAIEQDCTIR